MNLIINNIEELKKEFGYQNIELLQKGNYVLSDYDDILLKTYEQNVIFLEILRNALKLDFQKYSYFFLSRPEITKEVILYSQYYWNHQFIRRAKEISINTGDAEEWEFWLIKQIDLLENPIDIELLEKIDRM